MLYRVIRILKFFFSFYGINNNIQVAKEIIKILGYVLNNIQDIGEIIYREYRNFSIIFYKINGISEIFSIIKLVAKWIHVYILYRLGSKIHLEYNIAFLHERKNRMGYHRRYRRVFLDISNNIQPRAQTKWKVLKWYRDGRGCNILRILKSFDGKHHSIFNVSRIHRKLNNVLRNLFVRGGSHRSSASQFPSFLSFLQYVITPNFYFPHYLKFKNETIFNR